MGDRRGAHRVLVGRPDGKKQLGRPKRRWKDNNEVDGVGRHPLDRDRWRVLVNAVMNLRDPENAGNFLAS
jgi:hypothetical protein